MQSLLQVFHSVLDLLLWAEGMILSLEFYQDDYLTVYTCELFSHFDEGEMSIM